MIMYREATLDELRQEVSILLGEIKRRERGQTTMSIRTLVQIQAGMITPETIRSLIIAELRLSDLPMNITFHEAGLTNHDLQRISILLTRRFNKTVSSIKYIDTVYTLTDRFNGQHD